MDRSARFQLRNDERARLTQRAEEVLQVERMFYRFSALASLPSTDRDEKELPLIYRGTGGRKGEF